MSRDRRDVEDRVRTLLEAFHMKRALSVLASVLPADKPGRTQTLEVFERLLRAELDDRRERRIARRLEDSHLPDRPTLETFDFAFQPKLDKALVLDLAQLAWVERKEDLVLVGDPGVGKSHIAKALCVLAAGQERRVLYTTCADMMLALHAALADGSLRQRIKRYTSPELLLIDDLGYDPLEQEHAREAQLLHKVLEGRHSRVSTIVTSNLDVDAWAEYLGHPQLTMALLDKLLFHATAIRIDGPSYRLDQHEKRKAARKSKKSEGGSESERESRS
jgi:DNA replication protein DnaC